MSDDLDKKQKDLAERMRIIREEWPARIARLVSERHFCLKHGFTPSVFNRLKNLHNAPRQASFDKVEEAFRAEGV